jgi:uncharacterized protein
MIYVLQSVHSFGVVNEKLKVENARVVEAGSSPERSGFFIQLTKGYNQIMDTKTQLNESVKDAMKSGDEVRKRTVRMVLAAVKQAEVDKQTPLEDLAVVALIQKEIKNRREAIEEANKANRPDLIEGNESEIKVLEVFLPKAMPADELRALVQAAIDETGASAPSDMGKVMKIVMPKVAGRAPNDMISSTVKELLTK